MRASEQEQKGGAGQDRVAAQFALINWGVAENSKHDLGTDLFLMARDHRLIDLGMVVGAQVKAGESYFREPHTDPETAHVDGWWYRESIREHFDAWLAHQLPHLIVLHDFETGASYWAQVTAEAVEFTRKGAKIFVPAANTIDRDHADALSEVAASKAARTLWEGSAWGGAESLSPSHQLRYALIAPRLVAPHPNQGKRDQITPVQAVALLVQARLRDLTEFREQHESVPDLSKVSETMSWDWRAAAALHKFVTSGQPDVLKPIVATARAPHELAAATVALAAGLLEASRADEAKSVLVAALDTDSLDLVDDAWVRLQLARTKSELGDRTEARNEALPLLDIRARAPEDLTASAIAGAAANLIFTVSDWGTGDLALAISAADTTESWWRHQVTSWGLSAQVDKAFKAWAHDESITMSAVDKTWQHLRSASLMAGLLGNHDAWRHAMSLLARYLLMAKDYQADAEIASMALTTLRHCGDEKAVRLATRHISGDGPATAARDAALAIDPRRSTRTSAYADLALLIEAGDLLPEADADRVATWAMATFQDSEVYDKRVRPTFLVRRTLVDVLTGTIDAVSGHTQEELADFILDLPSQDDSIADRLARLVAQMPNEVWSDDRVARAAHRADDDNWQLRNQLLRIVARQSESIRDRLMREAEDGSLDALGALGDVTTVGDSVIAKVVPALARKVDQRIDEGKRGHYGVGTSDPGHDLVVVNTWHPQHADWDTVYRLLSENRFGGHISGALRVLAAVADELPDEVAERLAPIAREITQHPPPTPSLFMEDDARPHAVRLAAELARRSGTDDWTALAALARGDAEARRTAARVARSGDQVHLGVLMVLAGDQDPTVRASAARAIAARAADGDSVARSQLTALANDPGVLVPRALAVASLDNNALLAIDEIAALRDHPSALARRYIREARRELASTTTSA